jgi:hypothetical protein
MARFLAKPLKCSAERWLGNTDLMKSQIGNKYYDDYRLLLILTRYGKITN